MDINKPIVKKVAAAVGGLTLGFIGGFAIGRYRAKKEFMANLDEEIQKILQDDEDRRNQPRPEGWVDYSKPPIGEALADLEPPAELDTPIYDDMITQYGGHTLDELRQVQEGKETVSPEKLKELQEHFDNRPLSPRNPAPEPEPEPELKELDRSVRTLDKPYVISIDEYHEDEDEGQEKITITYYVGGETPILATEDGRVIDDIEYAVGENNLQRFGEGSQDPNIVYIRNHQNGLDYEVVRSQRSYSEAVLGAPEVPQNVPMQSMREGDDV